MAPLFLLPIFSSFTSFLFSSSLSRSRRAHLTLSTFFLPLSQLFFSFKLNRRIQVLPRECSTQGIECVAFPPIEECAI